MTSMEPPEQQQQIAHISRDLRSLSRGFKLIVSVVILALSYPNIRLAMMVPLYEGMFTDMLGGTPLPALTRFTLSAHWLLLLLSVVLPIVGMLAALLVRTTWTWSIIASVVLAAVIVQFIIVSSSVMAPFHQIIRGMQNAF